MTTKYCICDTPYPEIDEDQFGHLVAVCLMCDREIDPDALEPDEDQRRDR